MDRSSRPASFSLLRASLTLGLVVGLGLPAVLVALRAGGGGRFIEEIIVGAGLSLAAAWVALLPVWWGSRRDGWDAALMGILAGLIVRLTLTVAGVGVLASATSLQPLSLAVPTLGWYILLLLIEMVLVYRFLMHGESASGEEAAW